MADLMTPQQRSRCMFHIRSAATGPEMRLRRALWSAGLRFRVRGKVCGKPDVVFTRVKLAIFVDGCFWHGCPLHGTRPKSNTGYWIPKIERNMERDREVTKQLQTSDWCVVRFWEHELEEDLPAVVEEIQARRLERLKSCAAA